MTNPTPKTKATNLHKQSTSINTCKIFNNEILGYLEDLDKVSGSESDVRAMLRYEKGVKSGEVYINWPK